MNKKVQSARGLFRATGKRSHQELLREPNDFYATPPEPIRAFLKHEYKQLRTFKSIWEPAAGDGALAKEMEDVNLHVFKSDLIDRGCRAEIKSFYEYKKPKARAIVTNPPYSECNSRDGQARWILHALKGLNIDYLALLLNWSWPGARGLSRFWNDYPPARVYLMRWRIDFTGQGAPPMLNGWFVWDKVSRGDTLLRIMDRSDELQQKTTFDHLEGAAVNPKTAVCGG